MNFVSYAQNYEDVMLWRALKHVKRGFYIDVGANHPTVDSVTRLFYERGWQGINVEPLKQHIEELNLERLRDINLAVAAGEAEGELELWDFGVRGWGSLDESVVKMHGELGHNAIAHKVPVMTLAQICSAHVTGAIHFLKVDVEGFEYSVLKGMDFFRYRPWIVVVESTRPNSPIENYSEWEVLLTGANYEFVYADGLNRFYLASEQKDLASAFKYPPNVFDDFTPVRLAEVIDVVDKQAVELGKIGHALQVMSAELAAERERFAAEEARFAAERAGFADESARLAAENVRDEQLRLILDSMSSSLSWKLTQPLRWGNNQLKLLRRHGAAERIKSFSIRLKRSAFFRVSTLLRKHPRLRRVCVKLLVWLGVYDYFVSAYTRNFIPGASSEAEHSTDLLSRQMPTARSMEILNQLKLKAHKRTESE